MRVEQRIGRIDRLGQQSEPIAVVSFVHKDTIDDLIYQRLYVRLDLCRQALGDFEAVLGEEVRELTADLLSGLLTEQQKAQRIDLAGQALENLRNTEKQLEDAAGGLIAHGDLTLRTVRAAHELNRWILWSQLSGSRHWRHRVASHDRKCSENIGASRTGSRR